MSKYFAPYAVLGGVIIGLWYFILYAPAHENLSDVRNKIAEAEVRMADYQRTLNEVPVFLRAQAKMADMRRSLDAQLYAKQDILDLFDWLERQAVERDLLLMEITPPVEELLSLNSTMLTSEQPPFLNVNLKLRGGYIEFGKYIETIEQASFFRGINTCSVIASADESEKPFLHLNLKVLLSRNTEGV